MKKAKSVYLWGKAEVLCLLLFFALGVLFIPAQVRAYYIEYSLNATVGIDQQAPSNKETNGRVEIAYSALVFGLTGLAEANTSASLTSGLMKVYTHATNESINSGSAAAAKVRFSDTLYFTVPAGDYLEDVVAKATVFFEGDISHQGLLTSVAYAFGAWFGSDYIYVNPNSPNDGHQFQEFVLNKLLVRAGRLDHTTEISVPVEGYLDAAGGAYYADYGPTEAKLDFYNSAGFLSLQMPDGVTWRSESGAFLTPQIPLPGSLVLLSSGLLGLAGWRSFRKKEIP